MVDYFDAIEGVNWPHEAEKKYDRIEVLGKGSFGMVWCARRRGPSENELDEEYVAAKTIKIKDQKARVYAEREINILQEMRHPNVIRLIKAYPEHDGSRLVVMQLARGPNLHQLVIKRGALGLPLTRLVSRQLIAAVSYLHGRAVIHRDIKPSNCIVARSDIPLHEDYDWFGDELIWSDSGEAQQAASNGRWKLMLVDFGFARALEQQEIEHQAKKLRNSILFEKQHTPHRSVLLSTIPQGMDENGDDSDDEEMLGKLAEGAAKAMRGNAFEPTNTMENEILGSSKARKRQSGISMPLPERALSKRHSTARQHVRSMSALGTKAYAAPEIRKKLRHKNEADLEKANAAMTECVADYGMIVDSYSVGWTLRVTITGVPPNFTISEYMKERDIVALGLDGEPMVEGCCCFGGIHKPSIKVRDPSLIPSDATLLISSLTEKSPEDRMTVREAQNHPWILGDNYSLPQGDVPSMHGDPVVPLTCASELSKLTVEYHLQ